MKQTNNNLVTFGDWLSKKRAHLGFSLFTLQKLTHVDDSTLSRIERKLTEPSLFMATRICHGLGMTMRDLLDELQAQNISKISVCPTPSKPPDVLTIADLQLFSDTYFGNSTLQDVQGILVEIANLILQNAERRGISIISGEASFRGQEFDRLLHGSTVVHLELRQPPPLDAQDVSRLFTKGGVITLKEVGIYIRALREQGVLQASNLQKLSKNSVSILLRLENGDIDHITLTDALIFGQELNRDSLIQKMFWRACNFHWRFLQFDVCTQYPPVLQESQVNDRARLVSVLLTFSRWQEKLIPDDKQWLYNLRTRLEQIRQNNAQAHPLL